MSGMMRSTPGVSVSRPNSTPQSTTIHWRSLRRPEAIGVEIHADLARPAQRQEDQLVAAWRHQSCFLALRAWISIRPRMVRSGSIWSMAGMSGAEQMGQPAGGDHRHGLAIFLLDARRSGRRSGRHSPNRRPTAWRARCRVPITFWARWMATRGSSAAAWCSASMDRLAPGAITLPSKSPFSATMSKVVAVPKSTTITAPL